MTRILGAGVFVLTAILLTSCSAPGGDSTPTASRSPTSAESATPSPSATGGAVVARDCRNVLSAEVQANIVTEESNGFAFSTGFVEKMRDEGYSIVLFADWGGVLCHFGMPNTDNASVYGWSPITSAQAAERRAALLAEGYSESPTSHGSRFSLLTEGAFPEYYEITATDWYCATSELVLDSLIATTSS